MQIKSELRKQAKQLRKSLENKCEKDLKIESALLKTDEYKNAQTLLIYASLEDEIKTDGIIENALKNNKTVAAARCLDSKGKMDFYVINSLSDLTSGSFGIREPDINLCKRLETYNKSVIIVPGLIFDEKGFRIGFGGGYYDRFLAENKLFSIGLCYDELLYSSVPSEENDIPVNVVITQSRIIRCGGKNG